MYDVIYNQNSTSGALVKQRHENIHSSMMKPGLLTSKQYFRCKSQGVGLSYAQLA